VAVTELTAFTYADRLSPLGAQWRDALLPLRVWHPNGISTALLHLSGDVHPVLKISLDRTVDTRDQVTPMRSPFVISCVRLTYFPGETLARQWFAAGWAGYCLHEAQELVTIDGAAVLDPHAAPFAFDRGLRDGLPPELTPVTMIRSLAVAMSMESAIELVRQAL